MMLVLDQVVKRFGGVQAVDGPAGLLIVKAARRDGPPIRVLGVRMLGVRRQIDRVMGDRL